MKKHEPIFTKIYDNNSWRGEESRSGPSSGMRRTESLREQLPIIFKKYDIQTFLDIPCGDFFWMKHVKFDKTKYIGGDIVKKMIDTNNHLYSNDNISFQHIDLINESLPSSNLLFCRDCLFHMSYKDVSDVLENLLSSNIKYFMTTSHKTDNNFHNKNIPTGHWRYFDLTKAPFCLPENLCLEKVEDGGGDRYMMLWKVSDIKHQIQSSIKRLRTYNSL